MASEKHYRVIKDTPAWEVGAIVKHNSDGGYSSINELYNKEHTKENYFETASIVEGASDFFERVYPVGLLTKTIYKAKAEAREMLSKEHTA